MVAVQASLDQRVDANDVEYAKVFEVYIQVSGILNKTDLTHYRPHYFLLHFSTTRSYRSLAVCTL